MDNGSFRAQHQIFSHLFLGFVEIAAATSLLPDKLCFLTNWKPWDIDQAQPEGCAVLLCWLLSGFLQAAWCAQEQPGTGSGAALGATDIHVPTKFGETATRVVQQNRVCHGARLHLPVPLFFTWLSDLVAMLDITHLGYMKENITTTLPNKSLKPAGIEDSWMEKWNNPVWCFHLQAGR